MFKKPIQIDQGAGQGNINTAEELNKHEKQEINNLDVLSACDNSLTAIKNNLDNNEDLNEKK